MSTRRGFTLVELMVAMVMTALVGAVTYRLLVNHQRVSRSQAARIGLTDNVRAGAIVAANELRELGYDSVPATAVPGVAALGQLPNSDLLLAQPGRVRYRAFRGFGVTCAPPSSARLVLRRALYYGVRDPVVDDSAAIFVEGSPPPARTTRGSGPRSPASPRPPAPMAPPRSRSISPGPRCPSVSAQRPRAPWCRAARCASSRSWRCSITPAAESRGSA